MSSAAVDARSVRRRRRWAWAAPIVVAGGVATAAGIAGTSASGATPSLAHRTPAQLIAAVATSRSVAFTGQVDETAALGLPSLPGDSSTATLSWQSFLTGTHSARVWADGPDKQRLALLGQLSEADVIHNGRDVWTYTSDTNTVTHTTLPAHGTSPSAGTATPSASDPADSYSPSKLAAELLKAVTPTTSVTTGKPLKVAHHSAYTLVLKPKSSDSTVRRVVIAIDSKTSVPLRVQVYGSPSTPALSLGFSSVDFSRPAASVFAFRKPAGATVSSNPLTADRHGNRHEGHAPGTAKPGATKPGTSTSPSSTPSAHHDRVIGSGWTSVLETGSAALQGAGGGLLDRATTAVPGMPGARELHTTLLNVLMTSDGRVFAGAVSQSFLKHIAATTPN